MDHAMSHEQVAELLGAYALDAVDADEARAVAGHLEVCPRCAAELAEHHDVAGMLAGGGDDAPPHLWDRIAAGATAPSPITSPPITSPPITSPPITSPPITSPPITSPPATPSSDARGGGRGNGVVLPGPGFQPPTGRGAWVRRVAVAVAAVAAVLAVVAGIQVARLDTKVNNLSALRERQGVSQAAQAALLDPSAQRVALTARPGGTPTLAEIVRLPSGTAFLVNRHLAPLPKDRTYQLWAVGSGRPVSLGLLGNRPASVPLVLGTGTETTLAITVEPAGGVVAPTTAPIATS